MVKNSKEYMREYQKARRAKLKAEKVDPSLQSLQGKEVKVTSGLPKMDYSQVEIKATPRVVRDQITVTNGMRDQLKAFGKTVPFDDIQDAYMKLILYKEELKYAVDNWLSTRKNKSGPENERKKLRMGEIYKWLMNF